MNSSLTSGPDPKKAKLYDQLRARGMSHEEAVAQIEGGGSSLGQQFAHGAGLIGRMAVQGAGNLASMPFGLAGAAYQGVTGNQPPAMLQGNQGTAAADQMGLPQPQGAGERILAAGGENAVMSGILPGAGPGLAALGGAAGMAGQAAGEAGAGPMGQMAASAAVGMGMPVVGAMGAAAWRSAIAGSATRREAARQSMALLQAGSPDAPLSLGQVTTGGIGRLLTGGLRNVPGASERLRSTYDAQAEQMGQRATRIADQISPGGTPTSAGVAIQRGISEGFVPSFRAQSKALYNKVFQLVPPETPVIPAQTLALGADMGALAASARPLSDELFANGKMGKWLGAMTQTLEASPQGIPFNVLKEWRSTIGEMLDGGDLIDGISRRDLHRLRGALTDDMGAAVATRGPEAIKAWRRANLHWEKGMKRLDNVLQPLMDKRSPEIAFNAAMAGTKDGATLLRSTMHSLRGDERKMVASTVLRRLGGEEFVPETYLRNWKKLAPEAKSALFEGTDPQLPKDLNRLAQAIELRKQSGKTLFNPAGTSANVAFFSIMSGLGAVGTGAMTGNITGAGLGAALGPSVAAGVGNLAARAFTNPRIIRWLVKQTTVPFGAMTQQLAILAKDSQKWDPESRDIATDLTDTLGNMDWRNILLATAVADQTATR